MSPMLTLMAVSFHVSGTFYVAVACVLVLWHGILRKVKVLKKNFEQTEMRELMGKDYDWNTIYILQKNSYSGL